MGFPSGKLQASKYRPMDREAWLVRTEVLWVRGVGGGQEQEGSGVKRTGDFTLVREIRNDRVRGERKRRA